MSYALSVDQNIIESTNTVKLKGVNIEDKLRLEFHTSKLCSNAVMQLNASSCLKKYMGKKKESQC